ncbi:MAG: hypothetical protein ABFD90_19955 [Phycisphaerales bacterium]
MKTIQMSALMVGVLLLAGVVNADIVAIQHTMDYENNSWANGVWFVEWGAILDHSPYCRASTEDWGWTHVVTDLIPAGATGIESATLTIVAWKIDVESGEDDVIYALPEKPATTSYARTNGDNLGVLNSATMSPIAVVWPRIDELTGDTQINGYEYMWSTTTFDLPAEALEDLWENGQVCFYMDIDQTNGSGMRATLKSAVLQVNYIAPAPVTPPLVNVYRFWSPVLAGHFYTASEADVKVVTEDYADVWDYECIAFAAMADDTDSMAVPVHRFWSPFLVGHFYTASEYELEYVIANYYGVWAYEGVAFYVYPPDYQPEGTYPVYRFWSPIYSHHFYTISEADKENVMTNFYGIWGYEGIAWYAFKP